MVLDTIPTIIIINMIIERAIYFITVQVIHYCIDVLLVLLIGSEWYLATSNDTVREVIHSDSLLLQC